MDWFAKRVSHDSHVRVERRGADDRCVKKRVVWRCSRAAAALHAPAQATQQAPDDRSRRVHLLVGVRQRIHLLHWIATLDTFDAVRPDGSRGDGEQEHEAREGTLEDRAPNGMRDEK